MQRAIRAGQNRHKCSEYVMGCQRYAFACSVNSGHWPFTEVLTVSDGIYFGDVSFTMGLVGRRLGRYK